MIKTTIAFKIFPGLEHKLYLTSINAIGLTGRIDEADVFSTEVDAVKAADAYAAQFGTNEGQIDAVLSIVEGAMKQQEGLTLQGFDDDPKAALINAFNRKSSIDVSTFQMTPHVHVIREHLQNVVVKAVAGTVSGQLGPLAKLVIDALDEEGVIQAYADKQLMESMKNG